MQPKAAAAGDRALLVELGFDVPAGTLHARAIALRADPNVLACIVGHSSLYVIYRRTPELRWSGGAVADLFGDRHVFDVSFAEEYAPDLPEFLAHVRLTRDEFLRRIDGLELTARYLGFRGGWAYLDGWPAEWAMPRRPMRPLCAAS